MSKVRMNNRDNQLVLSQDGSALSTSVYNIYPQKDYSLRGLIRLTGGKKVKVSLPSLYHPFWSVI